MRPGRNGGRLQTGNPRNAGGQPGRSGRRPAWQEELARHLVEHYRVFEVVAAVAVQGTNLPDGDKLPTLPGPPVSIRDRIAAVELLLGYAYGQPGRQDDAPVLTDAERLERMGELLELGRRRWAAKQRSRKNTVDAAPSATR